MATTRAMITGMAVAALCVVASGCGPVTMASVAVSGISVAFTGKGLAEHALSGIRDEDCAVLNVLDAGTMCVPYEDAPGPVVIAGSDDLDGLAPASGPESPQVALAAPSAWSAPPAAVVEDDPVWRYMMARVRDGAEPAPGMPYSLGAAASAAGSGGRVSP